MTLLLAVRRQAGVQDDLTLFDWRLVSFGGYSFASPEEKTKG
jgi:hypothetical protein